MTEGRCDLILLGWTAFVGFNLVSDFLWSSGSHQTNEASGGGGLVANLGTPSSALFRGHYSLVSNNTVIEDGPLILKLVSQQTSVEAVRISSLSMALVQKDGHSSFSSAQSDFLFSAMAFGNADQLTATGSSDPKRFPHFGSKSCRVDAIVQRAEGALKMIEADASNGDSQSASDETLGFLGEPGSSITGEVAAVDCGFSMRFTAEVVNILLLTQKVVHYSIWVNLLTCLQIRCYLVQMRHTEEGPSAGKVSILCIAMQAMMDAYDSFLHLCLGLSSQYMFNTIAVVSLFKFILFSLLEARYMLTIWRCRRSETFNQGWEAVRRELSWLYSRFYGVLIIGMVLIYNNLEHLHIIALCFQAYWVPQIFQDAWQGSRSALRPAFFGGISVTRSLLMLYLWGCPQGIFSDDLYPRLPGAPSLKICAGVVLMQGVQVTVMMLQKTLGPRWFIPWICLPQAYNYQRRVPLEEDTDCVICMSEIDPEDARRVVTPCNHKFHRACLEQWIDIKMECPTCRMVLPPIQ